MLRPVEWGVQNFTKNGILQVTTFFFKKKKNRFSVRTSFKVNLMYQPPKWSYVFIIFISARFLFEGAFSLWVTLTTQDPRAHTPEDFRGLHQIIKCKEEKNYFGRKKTDLFLPASRNISDSLRSQERSFKKALSSNVFVNFRDSFKNSF